MVLDRAGELAACARAGERIDVRKKLNISFDWGY